MPSPRSSNLPGVARGLSQPQTTTLTDDAIEQLRSVASAFFEQIVSELRSRTGTLDA